MAANTQVALALGGAELNIGASGTLKFEDDGTLAIGTGSDVTIKWNGTVLLVTGLPTSDPSVAGALYSNSGVLTLSAGP